MYRLPILSDQPLISVVIPVFNAEKYIRRCLDSVTGSTLKNIEIVCVDDGSSDGSLAILNEYKNKDARIRVLSQHHLFAGAARNTGIDSARGEFIHFLDADDWIDEGAYEKWYRLAKDNDAEVCACMHYNVNSKNGKYVACRQAAYPGKQDEYFRLANIHKDPDELIFGNVVPWNKIYLRSFLIENDIRFDSLICAEDRSFYFAVIYKAERVVTVRELWIYHTVNNPSSLDGSDIRLANFDVHFQSFEIIWNLFKDADDHIKRKTLSTCIGDAIYYYKKSIGTRYEENIKNLMYRGWSEYLTVFGDDLFSQSWFKGYLEIVKDIEQKEGKITIQPTGAQDGTKTLVFSFDEKYAKYFSVALLSLIDHVSPDKRYEIIVLHDILSKEKQKILKGLMPVNMVIRFISVKTYAEVFLGNLKSKISSQNWCVATFYDLLIPLLMPGYERVLKCDSDMIFQANIDELFDIPFDGKKLIAVKDTVHLAYSLYPESVFLKKQVVFINNDLRIDNLQEYFNAGVLLFNNRAIDRQEYFSRMIQSLLFSVLPAVDQDVLNFIFKNNVKFISERFNFQYYLFKAVTEYSSNRVTEAYLQAANNPLIIHYTTHIKPWNTPGCAFGTVFWSYARRSPFYEEIIYDNLSGKQTCKHEAAFFSKIRKAFILILKKLQRGFYYLQKYGFIYTLKRCWVKLTKS